MDKKKIFAILLFLLMGLFMFSYANPVSDGETNLSSGETSDNNQETKEDTLKSDTSSTTSKVSRKSATYNIVTSNYVKTLENSGNNDYANIITDNNKPADNNPIIKTKTVNIALNGDEELTIEAGSTYSDAGATVLIDNIMAMNNLKPIAINYYETSDTSKTTTVKNVDTHVLGTYKLIYIYKDSDKNQATDINDTTKDFVMRTIHVVDTTAPVISLNGEKELTIEAGSTYLDAGATVTDNYDATITDLKPIAIKYLKDNDTSKTNLVNNVDTHVVGTYKLIYIYKDSSKNQALDAEDSTKNFVMRTIHVIDTTAPVISLNGLENMTIEVNSPYTELGVNVSDNTSENISVKITGDKVNTKKLGTYKVIYTASDKAGNTSTITRTVNVVDTTAPKISLNGAADITIEGGSKYTELGASMTDNYDAPKNHLYPIAIKYSSTNSNTDEVLVQNVDTLKLGTYRLLYIVKDSSNNQALDVNDSTKDYVTRYVHVVDTTSPVITLNGDRIIDLEAGVDSYTELNATAKDIIDGTWTVTPEFIHYSINGKYQGTVDTVDTTKVGQYKISYSCKDSAGNQCMDERGMHPYVIRVVNVVDKTAPTIIVKDDGTFGDKDKKIFTEVSFKLFDNYKVSKTYLNGNLFQTLTPNVWSDTNFITINSRYAKNGINVFTLEDMAGNKTSYTFTLNAKYKVTFENEDGSVISSSSVNYGESVIAPKDPIKDNTKEYSFTFAGWFDENGKQVTDFSNIRSDLTVTAKYNEKVNKYTVTFKDEDGSIIDESIVNYGKSAVVPANPTKKSTAKYSYKFVGWYDKTGKQVTDFSNIRSDLTVTAKYNEKVNKYTVTFKDEDKKVISESTVNYGKSAVVPENPTKKSTAKYSYKFVGWYDENDKQVTDFSNITSDLLVTAKYDKKVNQYTVIFKDEDGKVISESIVEYGKSSIVPENPTKKSTDSSSYVFTGWYDKTGKQVTDFSNIRSDLTVTAKYNEKINQYTVKFKNEDGKVISKSTVEYGKSAVVPANPTKKSTAKYSYKFVGWYDENDKQVTDFSNITSDLTVTAKYDEKVNQYTVKFVDYDNRLIISRIVSYGDRAKAPTNPTRTDFTFIGWDKTFDNVTSNMTVKALYNANIIGIRVESKGNAQLEFTQGTNYKISDYINVYSIYADNTKKIISEYTTNFSAKKVGTFKLKVNAGKFSDNSLSYKVIAENTYQTKFEVSNGKGSFRYTSNLDCEDNCDLPTSTASYNLGHDFIEIVEHYNEIVEISKVKIVYQDGSIETVSNSLERYKDDDDWESYYMTKFREANGFNSVRWSKVDDDNNFCNPVYILNVKNSKISKVTITYDRENFGKYDVEFTLKNGKFICTDEIEK